MSPGQHITILLEAARKAAVEPKSNRVIEAGSVLRIAPSHTGAELLGALRDMGWTLAPIAHDALAAERDRLRKAVEHYADDANWINGQEYKTFPGFHGAAVARSALNGGER